MSEKEEFRVAPNIVVFDIETGGFKAGSHPLVEVCFICYDGLTLEETDRYEALISPMYENPLTKEPMEYTPGAFNVHKITETQMEEEGIPLKQVAEEVIAKLKIWKTKGMFGKPILGGHNIKKFDVPFITEAFDLVKKGAAFTKEVNNQMIDSMAFATLAMPTSKTKGDVDAPNVDHKLGSVCKAMGISLVGAHRAATDTEANAKVILSWIKAIRGEGIEQISAGIENKNQSESFKF